MPTAPAGADVPSTHGGPGWLTRDAPHAAELGPDRPWAACGYRSEVAPLRSVLLARPPDSLAAVGDPAAALLHRRVDLGRMRAQADAVAAAYRAAGVEVHVHDPGPAAPPNVVFLRDLFLVTPWGAVVGRTASRQRAGEERHAAAALAALGIPILRTVLGPATFEGADALWLDPGTVLVGTGFRTDGGGARVLADVLAEQGVRVVRVPLGPGVQHLLGSVVFLSGDLVAVHAAAALPPVRRALAGAGYRVLEFAPSAELVSGRGLNLVALAPGRVLMPAGAPGIRRRLAAAGVESEEVDVGEYLAAAGGIGCLTGVLERAGAGPGRDR